jgi:CDAN1-interacting nuclease 1
MASTGLEHEARLYECLQAAGIAFWSEEQLRARGMFKTPDALLQVPICVRAARAGRSGPGWAVVHWIDSKASFGDDRTHGQQLEGQYRTYTNRYGPGLVIYWFGFLSDLDNDADVALTDAFPGPGSLYQLPRLAGPTGAAGSLVSPSPAPAGRGGGTKAAALPHGADDGVEAIAARAAKLSLGDEQRAQILPSVPQALVL